MTTAAAIIKGEAGNVLAFTVALGELLDGTTVTSASVKATKPDGTSVVFAATIETADETSIVVAITIAAQLARGAWSMRPFLYVAGVLVTSIDIDSTRFTVTPDRVPPP